MVTLGTIEKMIEIMDTTLRDGEQTNNVTFAPTEKLHIARILLQKLKVDRIEIASALVSEGERESVLKIIEWAGEKDFLNRIEILGYVDIKRTVDWISQSGGVVLNLLTKGSLKHLTRQLKKDPQTHFSEIEKTVEYGLKKGITTNVYLEDFSNGYLDSRDYVYSMVEFLSAIEVKRVMLPDTLGIFSHRQTTEAISDMVARFPQTHFDFHAHNDYGLATSNTVEAVRSGAKGIHTTINCLGERTGNASLAEVVASLRDHLKVKTNVAEKNLYSASKVVETFSGKRLAPNAPIVGEDVFTQTAGIHADGDSKGGLYESALRPERFGRKRAYALGKMAGKASLDQNLRELGIELSDANRKKVLDRIKSLGDKKKAVTPEDLPFIIGDVLERPVTDAVQFENVVITSGLEVTPMCSLKLKYKDKTYKVTGSGDGGYDAFMTAIRDWAETRKIELPELKDYEVRIPPGGKTSALVECKITWSKEGKTLATRGVDSDQTIAAVQATLKMLNLIMV